MSQENSAEHAKSRRFLALAALAAALIWAFALWPREPTLTVTFLDVRQGDSALIQTPGGKTILIDAGGGGYDVGSRVVAPFLRNNGIRTLDILVMTHPHQDHIGGVAGVLGSVGARIVLDSGVSHPSPVYERALRLIKRRSIRYVQARRGQRIELPDGVTLDTLNPGPKQSGGIAVNDQSVVLRMRYKRASFLFAGDADRDAEDSMLRYCGDIRSAVLKVGHHGSREATSELWLKAVRPRIAVISVGRLNQFGHPAPETLQRLTDSGVRIFRTDTDGAITITTNGKDLNVSTTRR